MSKLTRSEVPSSLASISDPDRSPQSHLCPQEGPPSAHRSEANGARCDPEPPFGRNKAL
jgi:hypothetical protein